MKAGKLRHKITLQHNRPQQNPLGEPLPDWVDYADNLSAEVVPLNGKEFYGAQQINTELTTKIRIRWCPNVKAGDRVIFKERLFLIATPPINVDEKNHELVLMCREFI